MHFDKFVLLHCNACALLNNLIYDLLMYVVCGTSGYYFFMILLAQFSGFECE